MKNSIAKGVAIRVLAILLVALAILFVASYFLVDNIITNNVKSTNEAMLKAYSDMVLDESLLSGVPITDENFAEEILQRGSYICELYEIDFAYLMIPNIESGKIKYLCVAQNKKFDEVNPNDKYIGKIASYSLTEDEKDVWHGKRKVSHSITEAKYNHEISTMMLIHDSFGHKVMAGVDHSYEDVHEKILKIFFILAIIIICVIIGIYLFVYLVIKRNISKPANILSKTMNEYITDGHRSKEKLEIKGNDEFSMISSAFNSMTDNISDYLNNINLLTREQEQQNTQLDIASRIQRGFLKDEYFQTNGCVIYADMIPAKHVAGDLYDYMPIGDDKFLTVIADVAGKGVSTSIFMAVTLILIREFAKMNMSPAEILSRVNDTLSENNPSMLFLTAIVGIYDSKTKTYTYANAGHNLPYIINNEVTQLSGTQSTLLGIFPGEKFAENSITLDIGDTLFMYTDGVNEAINENKEFFGIDRLESILKEFTTAKKENLVDYVNQKVSEFVADAERHDDITMLCFSPAKTKNLVLGPNENEFEKIKKEILDLPIPRNEQLSLCLAAEECFVNICNYAYTDSNQKGDVHIALNISNRITLRFSDTGMQFDPTKNILNIDDYDIENQVGGLGRFIAFNNVDDAKYEYKNGKNILTLTKYIV